MRSFALHLLIFLLSTSPVLAAGPSWPLTDMPRFWILGEGNAHFSVDGFYFHTKENYDQESFAAKPAALDHVRYGNMKFHVGFGFTPRVSLFAQTDVRALYMQNYLATNISDDDNYGFGDAFVGLRWLLYRSKATDRIYPTEWAPETWLALAETSWKFPMYDRAGSGKPPLGDQSNDVSAMGRLAWYTNEWLGFSGNAGYIYRTANYEALLPWGLRVDLQWIRTLSTRFWIDFQAFEQVVRANSATNSSQPDPFPNGSLLFKSGTGVLRTVTLGAAYVLGKEWEIAGAGVLTTSGVNTAKGFGGALGLVWRPYQMPELTYEDYRQQQIKRLQREPRRYRQRPVAQYGFQATVVRVSEAGNFFQIAFGQKDGVKAGDTFQVFAPDDFSGGERYPLALARVQVSRTNDSFLRVEQRYDRNLSLIPGYEVRRVIFAE
jgi:hypothetical protein